MCETDSKCWSESECKNNMCGGFQVYNKARLYLTGSTCSLASTIKQRMFSPFALHTEWDTGFKTRTYTHFKLWQCLFGINSNANIAHWMELIIDILAYNNFNLVNSSLNWHFTSVYLSIVHWSVNSEGFKSKKNYNINLKMTFKMYYLIQVLKLENVYVCYSYM